MSDSNAPLGGSSSPPGQFPAGGYPPGQFAQGGGYPPGQPGQFAQGGGYPPGQPGQFPPGGGYPPGQPGQFPPGGGGYPPGQPGQFPPGGGYPPGQPGQFPPGGGYPPGQPGQFPPGGEYQPGQFPPPRKRRRPVVLFIVLGLLAIGGIVGALQAAGILDGTSSVDDLDVGDCVMVPEDMAEVSQLSFTNCSNPHDGEVFFLATVAGDSDAPYPILSIEETAADECVAAFVDYTGSEFAASPELDIVFLTPTLGSWGTGDRGITCILTSLDGSQMTGSQAQ